MTNVYLHPVKYICAISFALTVLSCAKNQEDQNRTKEILVKTQQVTCAKSANGQEYVGTIESDNAVDISFLVPGNIEEMHVSEGQKVTKGQLLASLNTASLKSANEVSKAMLKQAEDAYKRMSAMYESKSLPEIQYIDAKTKLEQARAGDAIAHKNFKDGKIYAPQSGVVGKRYLEPGTNVMPGMPVYNIMDIGSVKVKIAIPEGEISGVTIGDKCEVMISALDNETFNGKVLEKGVFANPTSHTYDIKVKINNATGKIMPGMVCRTYLNTIKKEGSNSIVVPIKAVQVDFSGKRFVWVKDKQGKAVYKEVSLGNLSENGVHITKGLQEGEELIVEGYQNISIGTPVSVQKN
jgi:RND family efflux transporter MFP subunit